MVRWKGRLSTPFNYSYPIDGSNQTTASNQFIVSIQIIDLNQKLIYTLRVGAHFSNPHLNTSIGKLRKKLIQG